MIATSSDRTIQALTAQLNRGYAMTDSEIYRAFPDSVYQRLVETSAFQRLRKISFLGGIDYLPSFYRPGRLQVSNRFQHSLGVALLARLYCRLRELDPDVERALVCAGLLHDIGHPPLSHSAEGGFQERWGLNHHAATASIIRGEAPMGREVASVLYSSSLDPERIISIISGASRDPIDIVYSVPINFDTVEGISRVAYLSGVSQAFSRVSVVEALANMGGTGSRHFDAFWKSKQKIYRRVMNACSSIAVDEVCMKYVLHSDDIDEFDFYSDENVMAQKLRPLLDSIKAGLPGTGISGVDFSVRQCQAVRRVRRFSIAEQVPVETLGDLAGRYRSWKAVR